MKIYKETLYSCPCGYETLSLDYSSKHSKTKRCHHHTVIKKDMCLISEEMSILEQYDNQIKEISKIKEQLEYRTKKQDDKIKELEDANRRLHASVAKLTIMTGDEDDVSQEEGTGIIYFIVDKDVQDRGKIGRTKNTDIKRLKTRYSTFGNPDILCHWSTNIYKDENTLKKLMRDAGCMESHKEMISNVSLAREVFYEFIEM